MVGQPYSESEGTRKIAPKRKAIDWDLILSAAREVATTERMPSRSKVANRLGLVESTLNKAARRDGMVEQLDSILRNDTPAEGVAHNTDGSTDVTGPASDCPWTREGLMRHYGFDPEEWRVRDARLNKWGDAEEPRWQLRLNVIPVEGLIRFPDPDDWTPPPKPRKRKASKHQDVVVISDHHAPHHEPTFHRLFCDYLRDAQPDLIEVNGDLLDFSTISRHRERESHANPVNECLQAGFGILRDYREVCPDSRIRYKRGNHEERLQHIILDNAKALHRITAADDDIPALSLRRLLRLDELHVEYVDAEWDQAKTRLSPKLTARHGFTTSRNAGEAMLDKLAGSTIQGHTHRAGINLRAEHTGDEDDPLRVRMAIEGGCACIIPGGLGYIAGGEPNWHNAFGAFRIWPDGDFHADLGIYLPGRLLAPNGVRYE